MFSGESAKTLLQTVKQVYDQHIVVKTQFDSLSETAREALAEHRRLNERLMDKIEAQEQRIALLEARLTAFSEKAMQSAMADAAEKYLEGRYSASSRMIGGTTDHSPD